jgi:hypothetical protein
MLNATWFFATQPERRRTTLRWLSTLEKWSLADVLVVCVMVGILHLDWIVEPADIKEGLITDLPQMLAIVQSQYDAIALCGKFLTMECAVQKRVSNLYKCKVCQALVNEAYTRPEWARSTGPAILNGVDASGGGLATMRVVGMSGIYAFCGAVIVSILLSLIVDIFYRRAKHEVRKQEQRAVGQRRLQRVQQQLQQLQTVEEENSLHTPLLGSDTTTASPLLEVDLGSEDDSPPSTPTHIFSWNIFVLTFLTTVLVFLAVDINAMDLQVHGAGPRLSIGNDPIHYAPSCGRPESRVDGIILLMGTFALFCVLGPVVCSVLLVVVTLLDRCCHLPISPLMTLINFIGAFCSWEVFAIAIAIVMVQMLMPSITNAIVNDPVCASILEDGSCLQVQFNVLPVEFSTIVIEGFLLALTSWVSFAHFLHHLLL